MAARLAAEILRGLAEDGGAELGEVGYPKIDYQDIHYYAAPKKKDGPRSLDEVDPSC